MTHSGIRCVYYLRYSSDLQQDSSIESQRLVCEELAARLGLQCVGEYVDRALSGASLARPGIQSLIADARDRKFDYVLATGLDRISRDVSDTTLLVKQFTSRGITIHTATDGKVGKIDAIFKSFSNESFLQTLSDNTHRGMKLRALKGQNAGGHRYGYRSDVSLVNGKRIVGDLLVNEAEAQIVRRIFEDYAYKNKSPRKICHELNQEGVPSPYGRGWATSTLLGKRNSHYGILQAEIYIGRLVWGRTTRKKDPFTDTRVAVETPESEWVSVSVPELAIIPMDLWNAAAARKAALARKGPPRQQVRAVYLTSGLVRCACCGGKFVVMGQDHIRCQNAYAKGLCTNKKSVRLAEMESKVLACLKNDILQQDLSAAFFAHYNGFLDQVRNECNAERARNEAELARVGQALDRLRDAIINGGIDPTAFAADVNALSEKRKDLIRVLESAVDAPVYIHKDMSAVYAEGINQLFELMKNPDERDYVNTMFRQLIKEIILRPLEDGTVQIEVRGNIQGILYMSAVRSRKNKTNPVAALELPQGSDPAIQQIEKLVATSYDPTELMPPPVADIGGGRASNQMTADYLPRTP